MVGNEVWLRTNVRAHLLSMLPSVAATAVGCVLLLAAARPWVAVFGWLLAIAGALLSVAVVLSLRQPRLAYRDGSMMVHLGPWSPIAVPIDLVECFFLGQAPSMLSFSSGRGGSSDGPTASVVIRLAESAVDWKQRNVSERLGRWHDGYITIRGTWCEPISTDLMRDLNAKLAAAHRARRALEDVTGGSAAN